MNLIKSLHKFVIFSIPLFLMSGPFLPDLFMSLSCIFFLFLTFRERKYFYYKNIFFKIFILWCFYCIIVSLTSSNILLSLESSLFHFRFGIFALSIWYALDEYKNFVKNIFIIFLISFLILIFDGFIQYLFGQNLLGYKYDGNRLSSLFGDELIMGSYLSRFLPVLFGLFFLLKIKNIYFVAPFFGLILLVDIIVFLSGERSAFFYVLLSTFTLVVLLKNYKLIRLLTIILSLISIYLITSYDNSIKKRMINTTVEQFNLIGETKEDISKINAFTPQHETIFYSAYLLFLQNPLTGIGPKNFREECKTLKNIDSFKNRFVSQNLDAGSLTFCSTHPHNTYLQLLTETGIIGFIPVFSLFLFITYKFLIHFINIFKLKYVLNDSLICFYTALFVSLWPLVPSGNFFNNWLNIIYFFPVGFVLYEHAKK